MPELAKIHQSPLAFQPSIVSGNCYEEQQKVNDKITVDMSVGVRRFAASSQLYLMWLFCFQGIVFIYQPVHISDFAL
jgi:hypothetical protein